MSWSRHKSFSTAFPANAGIHCSEPETLQSGSRLSPGMRRRDRRRMSEDDPFLWLEEVEDARALAWVREQNARSLAALEGDPRYAEMYREALAVITAADRIPYPSFLGGRLTNFWQDEVHIRGLWRSTSPIS